MSLNLNNEWNALKKALTNTGFPKVTKTKVLLELLANGVAALCALLVYKVLQKFIVVKSFRNLWGLAAKKDKMLVSKDTFEWVSGVLVFIIALFVFTYVEALVENYLRARSDKEGK